MIRQHKYKKYTWIGNSLSEEDMANLIELREIKKKPITHLVRDAVRSYVKRERENNVKRSVPAV